MGHLGDSSAWMELASWSLKSAGSLARAAWPGVASEPVGAIVGLAGMGLQCRWQVCAPRGLTLRRLGGRPVVASLPGSAAGAGPAPPPQACTQASGLCLLLPRRPSPESVWAGTPLGCGSRVVGADRGLLPPHRPDTELVRTVGQCPSALSQPSAPSICCWSGGDLSRLPRPRSSEPSLQALASLQCIAIIWSPFQPFIL